MSTPAFGFDFSSLNPYITGLANRSLAAMDYRLAKLPQEDALNRRAYAEWLNNNASKRGIAEGEFAMKKKGFDAAQALGQRMEKSAVADRIKTAMDDVAAYSTPVRDTVNRGTTLGGPGALDYYRLTGRLGNMSRYGARAPANYTGITDLVNASSTASGNAVESAGRSARSGGCPPGYSPSPFGGCQPSGTGWGAPAGAPITPQRE